MLRRCFQWETPHSCSKDAIVYPPGRGTRKSLGRYTGVIKRIIAAGPKRAAMLVVYTRSIACQAGREKNGPQIPAVFAKTWLSPDAPHRAFDEFGKVTDEDHYDAGGDPVSSGTGYIDEAFAFTGRWFDKQSGLQNNLNRWYDPSIGRWLSEDPIGFAGDPSNVYRPMGNAPTVFTDPSGLEKRKQWPNDEAKRDAIRDALRRLRDEKHFLGKEPNLEDFVENYDPTWGWSGKLQNLEIDTPCYGNVDVDWMLTLLNAHYGNAPGLGGWLLKGQDPGTIYRIGKPIWIIKDGIQDPNVDIDFGRYGQQNELNAIKAARDLLSGKITLEKLFGIPCDDGSNSPPSGGTPPSSVAPPGNNRDRRDRRDRNRDRR